MATITTRLVPRYAHTPGPTHLTYTPNGKYLLTAGTNNVARKFTVGSSDEPITIEQNQDGNTGIAASNDRFITCSEDGTVTSYSMSNNEMEQLLLRFSLPTRAIDISPDGQWIAVSSDETIVKIVNVKDMLQVMTLREQPKPIKDVSFHPSGNYIAASCTDGNIYIYSLSTTEPELVKKLDGVIMSKDVEDEASTKAVWHPDGRAFAAVTSTRDIVVISRDDWSRQKSFINGHDGEITDIAWSPNGALLASSGADAKLIIWECKTQTVIVRHDQKNIVNLAWHPTDNVISFTTNQGQLFTLPKPVPEEHAALLKQPQRPAPLLNQEMQNLHIDKQQALRKDLSSKARPRSRDRDSIDGLFEGLDEEEDWLVDDDGAGYGAVNENGKRARSHADTFQNWKRQAYSSWSPDIHEPFQPGSTPWKGSRRYLHLSLIGFVWTVDQETHNTVTVEFYDRETHRDFHFTDPFLYDKACLNEHGTLFAAPPANGNSASIFYRPHETWTARADWRTFLPSGEDITSIALSTSHVVVCTSVGYVRVYSLYGIPLKVYRQKHMPVVSCASWRDYILVLGNGPVAYDGRTQLVYTIENIKRDEVLQENDVVAIPEAQNAKSVFFSEDGDPMIYTSDGVLLVLVHWRHLGQAKWIPLLDTKLLERLAEGRKEESYWPVAVSQDKFCCIILKGGEKYPYFPRPLLSEFDFKVPLTNVPVSTTDISPSDDLEEQFVRQSTLLLMKEDLVTATVATHVEKSEVARKELGIDKILLQMLALECKDEDRGSKALEIVGFMRHSRTLDMAIKVAVKYERNTLAEKISQMRRDMDIDEI